MTRRALFSCLLIALYGCSAGDPPSATWQLAAQGFYTGALSRGGSLAVVGSLNHGASLWRTTDHERMYNWSHASGEYAELVAANFSPDGSRAVTTDPRTLVLWDTQTGAALNFWATPGAVLDVALAEDNRHVLMGLDDHSAVLFDAVSGDYERTLLHQGEVGAVAISDDGELALTGSDDNQAILWSLNTGSALQTFRHDSPVRTVAISPSSQYTFTAAQNDLAAIWHNDTGQRLQTIHENQNHGIISARFSTDDRLLVIGYVSHKVSLFEVASGRHLQSWDAGTRHALRPTGAAILEVAFVAGQSSVMALSGDGRLIKLRRS